MSRKVAVVLMQFGGPDSLDAVEPFLYNLFSDEDIFELPFGPRFQSFVAGQISSRRAPTVAKKYSEIGGKSPIVARSFEQRDALQTLLDATYPQWNVKVMLAMRYWKPDTESVVRDLMQSGFTDVVLLPLYAQYSKTNAGSSFNEWDRTTARVGAQLRDVRVREYYTEPKYLAALSARIDEGLQRFKNPNKVFLLFSAHGTPIDMVEAGDPYVHQIRRTIELLMDLRGRDHQYTLSFQSKVGPKTWLTPATTETIRTLGALGIRDVLVIPIAFVSDHIETLHELNIEERETAGKAGIEHFEVMEGLNSHPLFIECLADLAAREIQKLHQ